MTTGGQIVHYKRTKWHHQWNPLRIHHMDCGPNCFFVLKYADQRTCKLMAHRTKFGIEPELITQILDEAYGKGHIWRTISQLGYSRKYLNETYLNDDGDEDYDVSYYFINTYLDKNEATFASVEYGNIIHFFVLLRDEEGFHAIDAQTGKTTWLEDYMRNCSKHEPAQLKIISSESHQRQPNKVTMNMIKTYFPSDKAELLIQRMWNHRTQKSSNSRSRSMSRSRSKSRSRSRSKSSSRPRSRSRSM